MKKFIPLIIFVLGVLVLVAVFFVMKSRRQTGPMQDEEEEQALLDVSLQDRPVASLTPESDGHWLNMKIDKIMVKGIDTMDYELLYDLPDGRTAGVPGTIKLEGQKEIDRRLLLGSESSGKFRYDEGVKNGSLTLRFRNDQGKLLAKFVTDFHLQFSTDTLSTKDGSFKYVLDEASDEYFVTMETFGISQTVDFNVASGPYGVFSSSEDPLPGKVDMSSSGVYELIQGEWVKLEDGNAQDVGMFVGSSS